MFSYTWMWDPFWFKNNHFLCICLCEWKKKRKVFLVSLKLRVFLKNERESSWLWRMRIKRVPTHNSCLHTLVSTCTLSFSLFLYYSRGHYYISCKVIFWKKRCASFFMSILNQNRMITLLIYVERINECRWNKNIS